MFHSKFRTKEEVNILTIEDVKRKIKLGIPDAEIEVVDTQGTGDHFSAVVISDQFDTSISTMDAFDILEGYRLLTDEESYTIELLGAPFEVNNQTITLEPNKVNLFPILYQDCYTIESIFNDYLDDILIIQDDTDGFFIARIEKC